MYRFDEDPNSEKNEASRFGLTKNGELRCDDCKSTPVQPSSTALTSALSVSDGFVVFSELAYSGQEEF